MEKQKQDYFDGDSWLEVFKQNYNGTSLEAKEIEGYLKSNYKGNKYIPWATMERLTYMQDPWAEFEKVKTGDGSLVFSRYDRVVTMTENVDGDKTKRTETHANVIAHFVRVRLTFFGKTFEEDYPVQDNKYEAVRIFDSNLINKALQRALAKVASRATGLGLKLYENGDLQFEDTQSVLDMKTQAPTETKKIITTTTPEAKQETTASFKDYASEILASPKEYEAALNFFNPTVTKSMGYEINVTDSATEINNKISSMKSPDTFMNALRKRAFPNA